MINSDISSFKPGFLSDSFGMSMAMIMLFVFFNQCQNDNLYDPVALFLTWQQDPTTTMTIDWHTIPDDGDRDANLQYKIIGDEEWINAGDDR